MSNRIEISEARLRKMYYEDGMSQNEIAAYFNCSRPTITRLMMSYGLITRISADYRRLNIPRDELYTLYVEQGLSAESIAEHYQCGKTVILNKLEEYEISRRHPKPPIMQPYASYVPPEVYAEWNGDLAYAVGLMTSDGCLVTGNNVVKFTSTEPEIMELFLGCLQVDPGLFIQRRKGSIKPAYVVEFCDQWFRAFLQNVGLTPNKSNTIPPLAIPDHVFFDFARGAWDGDGCWYIARYNDCEYLSYSKLTSGSQVYLKWVQATIERLTGLKGKICGRDLRYHCRRAVALGRYIYYAPDLPAFSVKREKWQRFA